MKNRNICLATVLFIAASSTAFANEKCVSVLSKRMSSLGMGSFSKPGSAFYRKETTAAQILEFERKHAELKLAVREVSMAANQLREQVEALSSSEPVTEIDGSASEAMELEVAKARYDAKEKELQESFKRIDVLERDFDYGAAEEVLRNDGINADRIVKISGSGAPFVKAFYKNDRMVAAFVADKRKDGGTHGQYIRFDGTCNVENLITLGMSKPSDPEFPGRHSTAFTYLSAEYCKDLSVIQNFAKDVKEFNDQEFYCREASGKIVGSGCRCENENFINPWVETCSGDRVVRGRSKHEKLTEMIRARDAGIGYPNAETVRATEADCRDYKDSLVPNPTSKTRKHSTGKDVSPGPAFKGDGAKGI